MNSDNCYVYKYLAELVEKKPNTDMPMKAHRETLKTTIEKPSEMDTKMKTVDKKN